MVLTQQKRELFTNFFKLADTSGDGSVSKMELAKVLREKYDKNLSLDKIVVSMLFITNTVRKKLTSRKFHSRDFQG